MAGQTLNRDDWIDAGLRALLAAGPDAVAVQPLAIVLKATKGSFYWHFSGRPELLQAVLERWLDRNTAQIIKDVESRVSRSGSGPREHLRLLLATVTEASMDSPGEQRILAGAHDPAVQAAISTAARVRIDHIAGLLQAAGLSKRDAATKALVAYTWYLGHAQFTATMPGLWPASRTRRREILTQVLDQLLG